MLNLKFPGWSVLRLCLSRMCHHLNEVYYETTTFKVSPVCRKVSASFPLTLQDLCDIFCPYSKSSKQLTTAIHCLLQATYEFNHRIFRNVKLLTEGKSHIQTSCTVYVQDKKCLSTLNSYSWNVI